MLKKVISDAALSTGGTLAAMASGLLVMPHLISVMGAGTYGLWTLVAGLAVYLGLLDFGVTAAVCRLSARSKATANEDEVNQLMSTAVFLLGMLGLILGVLTWIAPHIFFDLFNVPPTEVPGVRDALLIVGGTIAVTVPLEAFTGLLWAYERFDLINSAAIASAIIRATLILVYVGPVHPLLSVATINAVISVATSASSVVFCYCVSPRLRISPQIVSAESARSLFAFGKWMNMLALTKALLPQLVAALIAKILSASQLTTFAVARQLVFYTNDFTNSATQVVAPHAAKLDASGDREKQRGLMIDGGRVSYALGLFFFGGYVTLGAQFIHVWQRGNQDGAYALLVILMAGELLPTSQWVTYGQIVGAMRQRLLGYVSLLEALLTGMACVLLLPRFGLIGGAIGIALVASLVRGAMRMWYGCMILQMDMLSYARQVLVPVSLQACIPIVCTMLAIRWWQPDSWIAIVSLGALYGVLFVGAVGAPLLGTNRLIELAGSFAQSRH